MPPMRAAPSLPFTPSCRHPTSPEDLPPPLRKYYHQRHRLFSLYDEGVRLTRDAWFGVTPECVAASIADHLLRNSPSGRTVVVDLFAGVGGNSIAFALAGHWDRVVAVERDESTLACAQHNARLYGVEEGLITWVLGDSFEYLRRLRRRGGSEEGGGNDDGLDEEIRVDPAQTVLFASPPWGGPGYLTDPVFNLHTMEPYNLGALRDAYSGMPHALYLPRTSDVRQLAKLVPAGVKVPLMHYCVYGASKAMVVYLPAGAENGTRKGDPGVVREHGDEQALMVAAVEAEEEVGDEEGEVRKAKRQRRDGGGMSADGKPPASTAHATAAPARPSTEQAASSNNPPASGPPTARKPRKGFSLGDFASLLKQPGAATTTTTTTPTDFASQTSLSLPVPAAGRLKRKRTDTDTNTPTHPDEAGASPPAFLLAVAPGPKVTTSAKRNLRRRRLKKSRGPVPHSIPPSAASSSMTEREAKQRLMRMVGTM